MENIEEIEGHEITEEEKARVDNVRMILMAYSSTYPPLRKFPKELWPTTHAMLTGIILGMLATDGKINRQDALLTVQVLVQIGQMDGIKGINKFLGWTQEWEPDGKKTEKKDQNSRSNGNGKEVDG